jgi:hypothetical protein
MSVSAVAQGSATGSSSAPGKVDRAALAVSKALRMQREQADALVNLIDQAGAGSEKGRYISVRA